ncbi:hypothetical protein BpHYR1_048632 [Brachionus plicatilis]|uniref:Uncharacterized protein n=1 Tax=Brachionus plicatilis TaxID=10195 RepID=A0A3M7PVC5_BRAPC|nr:hypothetical protein BpHYR1_048632 [Brachionus plicatilis]
MNGDVMGISGQKCPMLTIVFAIMTDMANKLLKNDYHWFVYKKRIFNLKLKLKQYAQWTHQICKVMVSLDKIKTKTQIGKLIII